MSGLPPPIAKSPILPPKMNLPPKSPMAGRMGSPGFKLPPPPSTLPQVGGLPSPLSSIPPPRTLPPMGVLPPKPISNFTLPPPPSALPPLSTGTLPKPFTGARSPPPLTTMHPSQRKPLPPPNKISEKEEEEEEEEVGPSIEEQIEACLLLQRAIRGWKERKKYKLLYEQRKWTLHKEVTVLTNHVTKGRAPGRSGRRPPTRGRRVKGLEKPTYEDKRREEPEGEEGPTRSPKSTRPKSSIGGGALMFDPSKVKLRAASPLPVRKSDASAPNSPLNDLRKNLRPSSVIGVSGDTGGASDPGLLAVVPNKPPPGALGMPQKPTGGMPPKPSGPPAKPLGGFAPHISGPLFIKQEVSDSLLPIPEQTSSPVEVAANKEKKEKKKKVGTIINSFLKSRPTKEELIANGVLFGEDGKIAKKKGKGGESDSIPVMKEMERPEMQVGKTCMHFACKKKAKSKNNCYRCGQIFCKNCIHGKEKLPELKYTKAVPICRSCSAARQTEYLRSMTQ